jgi:hypothetical protein
MRPAAKIEHYRKLRIRAHLQKPPTLLPKSCVDTTSTYDMYAVWRQARPTTAAASSDSCIALVLPAKT